MTARRFFLIIPALIALAVIAAAVMLVNRPVRVPPFAEARASNGSTEARLLDRRGVVIHVKRVNARFRRLDWTPVAGVSPALINAVIASEDRRFYSHHGVDWLAMAGALAKGVSSQRPRGASTVTMQLASLLDSGLKGNNRRRSLYQKLLQMQTAVSIEKGWSKNEIMEAYLNLVWFRGELTGVGAASMGLFGKRPHGLNADEAAILAALIRSPNAHSADVSQRACLLAKALRRGQDADCVVISGLTSSALDSGYAIKPEIALAPHLANILLNNKTGDVRTTLDGALQAFASGALRRHLMDVRDRSVSDGAVLVVENRTGNVLAYVGSSGDLSPARLVDGIRARRQAGSTLKPLLYGLALDRRLLTAASVIDDSPVDIPVTGGIYRPANYDNDFRGMVTLRTALGSSLNVPAVKTLLVAGIDQFMKTLKSAGVEEGLDAPSDRYGPSLALGTLDVTLWELAGAYRTLANNGVWSRMRFTRDNGTKPAPRRVFSKEAAFIVSDILSDRAARAATFGFENNLSRRFYTAVKTGTSMDMRDNWCIGYSRLYTVGVWVGNFSGEPMRDVSGVTGAAPVWSEVMDYLHRELPSQPPAPPKGVAIASNEWFIKGTEPIPLSLSGNRPLARIIYPVSGEVIAIDPDIPADRQRVFFEAGNSDNGLRWTLDNAALGSAGLPFAWQPQAGPHSVSLIDSQGLPVDTVGFVVKGRRQAE